MKFFEGNTFKISNHVLFNDETNTLIETCIQFDIISILIENDVKTIFKRHNDVWEEQNESTSGNNVWENITNLASTDRYNKNDSRGDAYTFSYSFDYFMFIILFYVFLPTFIRIILFFILLKEDESIEKRKQLQETDGCVT